MAASSTTPVTARGSRSCATSGFAVEALHELYAPDGANTPAYYEIATAEWASRWPVEDLWVSRLTV